MNDMNGSANQVAHKGDVILVLLLYIPNEFHSGQLIAFLSFFLKSKMRIVIIIVVWFALVFLYRMRPDRKLLNSSSSNTSDFVWILSADDTAALWAVRYLKVKSSSFDCIAIVFLWVAWAKDCSRWDADKCLILMDRKTISTVSVLKLFIPKQPASVLWHFHSLWKSWPPVETAQSCKVVESSKLSITMLCLCCG